MCGIAGIIQFDGPPISDDWVDALADELAHRGPDGLGGFRDDFEAADGVTVRVALVHTRLAVIDLQTGQQPMVSTVDGGGEGDDPDLVSVIFNGCIYNHRELRVELEGHGRRFETDHSDTEVILRGYEEWGGKECVTRLDGMFAYAIYDRQRRTIMLARDRVGEKPLYFACYEVGTVQTLVFASTVPAILAVAKLLGVSNSVEIESDWLGEYLRDGYCAPIALPQENIQLLKPGYSLQLDLTRCAAGSPTVYWEPKERRTLSATRGRDFATLIRSAVHDRLEADVPLGCFLSGGLDSSLITKYALEKKPDLKTYCVRMPDARYDESVIAAEVAEHLKSDHMTLDIDQSNAAEDLVHLIEQLGMPFADSSILPTYWVSRAAREHVKVALSGDGGDELFLGYERFQGADWLRKYRAFLGLIPAGALLKYHPKSRWSKLGRLARAARGDGYRGLTGIIDGQLLPQLVAANTPKAPAPITGIEGAQVYEFEHYLADDLLRKVDTAAMSVALEVRAPFLATEIVEEALATPIEELMPSGERKGLLKNIARQHLPAAIVDRPKMGFAIPLGEWFRSDQGNLRTLLEDHLQSVEPFPGLDLNLSVVRRLLQEHLEKKRDHTHRLFALLTLSIHAKK